MAANESAKNSSGANGTLPAYRSVLPVAIDAAGGDRGMEVQVEGAIQAYQEFGVHSLLVGPEVELRSILESLGAAKLPVSIHNAPQTIGMHESPTRAVVQKPNSSLCTSYHLLENNRVSSMISAGNSGALMAAGIMISGLLPGIKRPAIATLLPSSGNKRPTVVLDSGANVDCRAYNLVQFAVMGKIYHTSLFGEKSPRVALLSNGTEASKGTDVIRAAAHELSQLKGVNFIGFVEGRGVPAGAADVIVCDGFVGNVLLKAMEGCVRLIYEQISHESQKGLFRMLGRGLSRGVYRDVFFQRFNYSAYGGAPLLGLRRLAIVLHGSSDSRAVKNAIRAADEFARNKMTEKIAKELALLEEQGMEPIDEIFPQVLPGDKVATSKAPKEIQLGPEKAKPEDSRKDESQSSKK